MSGQEWTAELQQGDDEGYGSVPALAPLAMVRAVATATLALVRSMATAPAWAPSAMLRAVSQCRCLLWRGRRRRRCSARSREPCSEEGLGETDGESESEREGEEDLVDGECECDRGRPCPRRRCYKMVFVLWMLPEDSCCQRALAKGSPSLKEIMLWPLGVSSSEPLLLPLDVSSSGLSVSSGLGDGGRV